MPKLTHPDLPDDVVIDVDERRAVNRRAAGWVDVEPDDPDDTPDDTQSDD